MITSALKKQLTNYEHLKAGAKYVGEGTTEHGIRYVEVAVPAVGKGEDVKIRVLQTKAGGRSIKFL